MLMMTFEFFGTGKHKITASDQLSNDNALFLDVRSIEDRNTLSFELIHHIPVLHIPINEILDRINEIPLASTSSYSLCIPEFKGL